jgi:hypothetical protein
MQEKSYKRVTSNLCRQKKACFKTSYNKESKSLELKEPGKGQQNQGLSNFSKSWMAFFGLDYVKGFDS